ncbi:MAG: hypothetical protein ACYTXA_24315 [Nostoc sp.]
MTLASSRKADNLEESLLREFEECLLQPDVRKSAKDVMQYGSVKARDAINRRLYKALIIVKTAIYRVFVI